MFPGIKLEVVRWKLVLETAIMGGIVRTVSHISPTWESDPVQVFYAIDSIVPSSVIMAGACSEVNPSLNRHEESSLNVSVAEVAVPHHGLGITDCEVGSSGVSLDCGLSQLDLRLSVGEKD